MRTEFLLFKCYMGSQMSINTNNMCSKFQRLAVCVAVTALLPACSTMNGKSEKGLLGSIMERAGGSDNSDFQKNIYAGAGFGYARLDPGTDNSPNLDVNDRVNGGGQVTLGMDVTPTFSVEVHGADLGSAGFSPAGPADGSSSAGRYEYQMAGASALAYIGKSRRNDRRKGFTGYGRLGIVSMANNALGNSLAYEREDDTPILLGAGVEYAAGNGLGVRAELMSNAADVSYGQVGLMYRMGFRNKSRRMAAAAPPPAEEQVSYAPPPAPPAPVAAPVLAAATAPIDTDGDGVYDDADRCPGTAPLAVVDWIGCDAFAELLEMVRFDSNSDQLTDESQKALNKVVGVMTANPTTRLHLLAHTDGSGNDNYNLKLSDKRAKAVVGYLSQAGVNGAKIKVAAQGAEFPMEPNHTAAGRATNRRVEVYANSIVGKSHWQEKRVAQ